MAEKIVIPPQKRRELVVLPSGHVVDREYTETLVAADVQKFLLDNLEDARGDLPVITPAVASMPAHGIDEVRLLLYPENPSLAGAAFRLSMLNFHAHWVVTAHGLRPDFMLSELQSPPRIDPLASPETSVLAYPLPRFAEFWFVVSMNLPYWNLELASFAGFVARALPPEDKSCRMRLSRLTLPNVHSDGSLCMGGDTRAEKGVPLRLFDQGASYARRWMHSAWGNHLLGRDDLERVYALLQWDRDGRPIRKLSQTWWDKTVICAPYGHATARLFFEHRARELADGGALRNEIAEADANAKAEEAKLAATQPAAEVEL